MAGFADFEAIREGDTQILVKKITEEDIRKFVEMTGDDNPLHVDRSFAEATSFKDIVVHGMLGASYISTVIGTKLPGPGALWISQSLEFLLPVRLGDELTVSCTVLKKHDRDRLLELDTRIVNQNGQTVLAGVGKVKMLTFKVPERPSTEARRTKVAIVSGGAGGIGKAICIRLANDGLNVAINYLGSEDRARAIAEEINGGDTRAIAVKADISTREGADRIFNETIKAFGAVDVLVNNASPRINPKPFLSTEWKDLQTQLDVQLKGAFNLCQTCIPDMAARHWGRIVNITSQAIDGSPSPSWTSYAVAKAGLSMMSRYLASELGTSGITVNCVSPGMTETALIGDIPEKTQLLVARQTPLRRLAKPGDIAAAIAYLVSEGGGFVTGQTLKVNGGIVES